MLWHRASRRSRQWAAPIKLAPRQLLLLSFIAIILHPVLDTFNTYGVRWLMPFSGEWFYGDTLFIIDPLVWLALSLGLYFSVRREKAKRGNARRPASLALGLVSLYAAGMALSGWKARNIVSTEITAASAVPVQHAMAGPVPLDPFVRKFVVEQEGQYRVGTFRWLEQPHVNPGDVLTFPRGHPTHPAFLVAAETPVGRSFLGWARFPTIQIQQSGGPDRFVVHMVDLRYARGPGERFGTVSIPVTLPPHTERGGP